MRPDNISHVYSSVVFQVAVETGVRLELKLVYLSHQCAALEVISPAELKGNRVGLPHVAAFAMPTINGYHHKESCNWKFFAAVQWEARDWYQKRLAVEKREREISDYIDHGITEDDVSRWLDLETGLRFHYNELHEIRQRLPG